MLNLSICDDNPQALQNSITLLERYAAANLDFSYQLKTYTGPEGLLSDYENEIVPDLILLDIYMKKFSGIKTAQRLRKQGYGGQIIFLTTSTLHALAAFEVDAAQYLVKPLSQEQFFQAMDKSLALLNKPAPLVLIIKNTNESHPISADAIVYGETKGHYQELHMADGQIHSMRTTAAALYDQLEVLGCFTQIGKMYLINFHYIRHISTSSLTMTDGTEIFLPRRAYTKLVEQYFDYYQHDS